MRTLTRDQQLALIYRHTHADYKGRSNGYRCILVLRVGGTHSVPLSDLTDAEIASKLPYAMHKEDDKRARTIIAKAEADLGKLSEGQRRDLLMDNTDWDSDRVRESVERIGGAS